MKDYSRKYAMEVCRGLSYYHRAVFISWLTNDVISEIKSPHDADPESVSGEDKNLFKKTNQEFIQGYLILPADITLMEVQELRDALRRASKIFFDGRSDDEIYKSVRMILNPSMDAEFKNAIVNSLRGHANDLRPREQVMRIAGYFAEFCGGSRDILTDFAVDYYRITKADDERETWDGRDL